MITDVLHNLNVRLQWTALLKQSSNQVIKETGTNNTLHVRRNQSICKALQIVIKQLICGKGCQQSSAGSNFYVLISVQLQNMWTFNSRYKRLILLCIITKSMQVSISFISCFLSWNFVFNVCNIY